MHSSEREYLRLVWSQEQSEPCPAEVLRREIRRAGWVPVDSLEGMNPEPGSRIVGDYIGGRLEFFYVPPGEASRWTMDELVERARLRYIAA